jgi:hypothetical protein
VRYNGIACLARYRLAYRAVAGDVGPAALLALGMATVGLGLLGATVASVFVDLPRLSEKVRGSSRSRCCSGCGSW